MIKHIVFFGLAEAADGKTKQENALIIKQHLEELINFIPQITYVCLYCIRQYVTVKIPYMIDDVSLAEHAAMVAH